MALALALLVASSLSAAPAKPPPEGMTLKANTVEVEEGVARAEGEVELRTWRGVLRADALYYDFEEALGSIDGEFLLADGPVAIRAQEGLFSVRDGSFTLRQVEFFQKEKARPAEIWWRLKGPELLREGKNLLLLRAELIERSADGRFLARNARLTPCDCKGEKPDFEVGTEEANVSVGDQATLKWPVIYLWDRPVLKLPWLWMPLAERKTGILAPTLARSATNGFFGSLPFFLVLGESYDLTLSPGWWLGETSNSGGFPSGMRGPRFDTLFRYAPHESTWGEASVELTHDLNRGVGATRERGLRGGFDWQHTTVTDVGFEAAVDAYVASDSHLPSSIQRELLFTPFTRSAARVGWRGEGWALGAGGDFFQPLAPFDTRRSLLSGSETIPTWQRPAVLFATVPSTALWKELRGGVDATALFVRPLALPGGSLDAIADAASITRVDIAPRLSAPVTEGLLATEVFATGRGGFTSIEGLHDGSSMQDSALRAMAGARAWTTLSRTFGTGKEAVRHAIVPAVELRGVTGLLGEAADPARQGLDELGLSTPTRFDVQALASVETTLTPAESETAFRLRVGQMASARDGELSDLFLDAFGQIGIVAVKGQARHDFSSGGNLFSITAKPEFSKGNYISASYDQTAGLMGLGAMRAGFDELYRNLLNGMDASAFDARQASAAFGLRPWSWGGLEYGFSATLTPSMRDRFPGLRKLNYHWAKLYFTSRCNCWHIGILGNYTLAPLSESGGDQYTSRPAIGLTFGLTGI